jgi:hypothetical protein
MAAVAAVLLLGAARGAQAVSATATYNVRFDATWSSATHPLNFPPNAHWSPLIGGTHDGTVQFWSPGALASQGIKDMAELGRTTPLDNEVQAAINSGHAGSIILGGGLATSPGIVNVSIQVTQQFSHVTLVTMVAPSPDWFAGVTGVDLLAGGDWAGQLTVPLYAYDAGTDSGLNYSSANQVTTPPQFIALNAAAPFQGGPPVGQFTFTRTDVPTEAVPAASPAMLAGLCLLVAASGAFLLRRRMQTAGF